MGSTVKWCKSGFHTEGGGRLEFFPPSHNFPYPEILKLSMVIILAIYMLLNVSMCHQNVRKFCPRLHQKQSERYINSKFSWGGMPPDPPSRHACISHTTIILLPSCFPPQLKILYETLQMNSKQHNLSLLSLIAPMAESGSAKSSVSHQG